MAGSLSDDDCWTRVYPEKGLLSCPRCYVSFWRAKLREKHVSESHNLPRQQWMCSECQGCFPTKRHVANHFIRAHPSSSSRVSSDDEDLEEDGAAEVLAFQCQYCEKSLPSKQGLRNHERQFHQAAVSAALAQQAATEQTSSSRSVGVPPQQAVAHQTRKSWTDQEVERFKEAAKRLGLKSNIALAKAVGTRSAKQIASFKSRFIRNNPTWAHLLELPTQTPPTPCSSVSTGGSTPPSAYTPNGQQRESVATPTSEHTLHDSPPPFGEHTVSAPSPSLSDLMSRQDDPGEQPRTSAMVDMANRVLRVLRRPAEEMGVAEKGSQSLSTPSGQPRDRIPSNNTTLPADSEVVEILNQLLETPMTWEREPANGPEEEVLTNFDLGDAPDWEELPPSPQPCTEENNTPCVTGWPFSPVSPTAIGYSPVTNTEETEDHCLEGGSESQGTPTPQGTRSGPDYALRDYLQGNVVFLSPRIHWPYSPIPPNTPGPGISNYLDPKSPKPPSRVPDRGWMDSQNSGKGKSPVGRKGYNKGGRTRKVAQGTNQPCRGVVVQGSGMGQGPTRNGASSHRPNTAGQRTIVRPPPIQVPQSTPEVTPRPRKDGSGRPRPSTMDLDTNQSPRGVVVQGVGHRQGPISREESSSGNSTAGQRATGHPPPTHVPQTTRGTAPRPQDAFGRPRPQTRDLGTTNRPATSTSNPPPEIAPLPMCKEDDRAPQKLFNTLRPLTGRVLSPVEWTRWCHGLERWTAGLSEWAYRRAEVTTPQKAWKRRQMDKRSGQQQGQRGEPRQVAGLEGRSQGPHQTGQPQRNRTITRMANLQRKYNDSPKQCMDAIRHTPPTLRCEVSIEEVNAHFAAKLASPQGIDDSVPPPVDLRQNRVPCDVLGPPITQGEVKRTLQSMDSRSAPGPDRIRYNTWKHLDPQQEIVTVILNTCRANGKIPPAWKTSATILIHKGDDPLVLDNWRPIALQNTLYKVYAAIIAKRISSWAMETGVMSPSQKGFLPMEGCLEHNHLMTSVLQDSRRRKRPAYLMWLDLKDAYGSVPHEILFRVMELSGLEGTTMDVVKDFYEGTTTSIRTKRKATDPITIKRGVKQGCPLSPILFNLVMEVLIRAAEEVPEAGYKIANSTIKSLAYADDLCILASSPQKLQEMLDRLHLASTWAGLSFSPRKCAALSIVRSYRARQRVDNCIYKLGDTVVPTMAWEDRYKYLGVKKGADHSPDLQAVGKEYLKDVEVIASSELTDWQKLDAIHRFAKPRLVYALQNQLPPIQWGKTLDKKVRALMKNNLKLPRRTNDGFMYAPTRVGGLGLPRVEDEIHIYGVSTAYRLLAISKDPIVTDTAVSGLGATAKRRAGGRRTAEEFLNAPPEKGEGKQGDIKSLWSRVRMSLQCCQATISLARKTITIAGREFGPSKRNLVCRAMRTAIQEGHLLRWIRAKDQGRAAECLAAHPSGNHWIRGGKYTSFSEYRFAHKARVNLLPTRTVRKRSGEMIADVSCPKCHEEQETLAHVLNHCPPHVGLIRARHNKILHRLAKAVPPAKGRQFLEQMVPGDRMALKPDLVILNEAKSEAYVVDVAVPFEGEESFPAARRAKEDKYNHLKALLRSKGYRKVEVDGFVIGALGSWDPENEAVLHKLSIGHKYASLFRKLCCTEAIKGSYAIWKAKTG
eukprot:Em0007g1134a